MTAVLSATASIFAPRRSRRLPAAVIVPGVAAVALIVAPLALANIWVAGSGERATVSSIGPAPVER